MPLVAKGSFANNFWEILYTAFVFGTRDSTAKGLGAIRDPFISRPPVETPDRPKITYLPCSFNNVVPFFKILKVAQTTKPKNRRTTQWVSK